MLEGENIAKCIWDVLGAHSEPIGGNSRGVTELMDTIKELL